MKLNIQLQGLEQVRRSIQDFSERRMRAAVATALTRTAVEVKKRVTAQLPEVLDKPTSYTMNAFYVDTATANRPTASVYLKGIYKSSPRNHYLVPLIEGGNRNVKRFEKALQAAGVMPTGWQAVPAAGAKLDSFGNVRKGQIIQILSQVGTELTAGFARTLPKAAKGMTAKDMKAIANKRRRAFGRAGGQYVALPKQQGKLKPGIYLATGQDFGAKLGYGRNGRLTPVFIFVKATKYSRRFDFQGIAQSVVDAQLQPQLNRAISDAAARIGKGAA